MIENIIVGTPDLDIVDFLAKDFADWDKFEEPKTLRTNERFLPKLLVDIGIAKSNSEVRKNRPELVRDLVERDYIEIKWGKKFIFILVFPQ